MNKLFSNHKHEKGQGLVEYAVIIALVAVVVVASMKFLGPKISCTFQAVHDSLPGNGESSNSNCGGSDGSVDYGFGGQAWWNSGQGATAENTIQTYCSEYQRYGSGLGYNLYSKTNPDGTTDYTVAGRLVGDGYTFQQTGHCP